MQFLNVKKKIVEKRSKDLRRFESLFFIFGTVFLSRRTHFRPAAKYVHYQINEIEKSLDKICSEKEKAFHKKTCSCIEIVKKNCN